MNPFIKRGLSNDDLVLFQACIRETWELLGDDDQFQTRVGIDWDYALKVMSELGDEIMRREKEGLFERDSDLR